MHGHDWCMQSKAKLLPGCSKQAGRLGGAHLKQPQLAEAGEEGRAVARLQVPGQPRQLLEQRHQLCPRSFLGAVPQPLQQVWQEAGIAVQSHYHLPGQNCELALGRVIFYFPVVCRASW